MLCQTLCLYSCAQFGTADVVQEAVNYKKQPITRSSLDYHPAQISLTCGELGLYVIDSRPQKLLCQALLAAGLKIF